MKKKSLKKTSNSDSIKDKSISMLEVFALLQRIEKDADELRISAETHQKLDKQIEDMQKSATDERESIARSLAKILSPMIQRISRSDAGIEGRLSQIVDERLKAFSTEMDQLRGACFGASERGQFGVANANIFKLQNQVAAIEARLP